jgi:DNA-directed RNA polymerase specialized sigma24 family protein
MCESLKEISEQSGVKENRIAQRLHKLRKSLKDYLDKKGYEL